MKFKILLGFTLLIISICTGNSQERHSPEIFQEYTGERIEIDGYEYYVERKGEGEPVFFLPGGPGNSHDYMQGNFGHYYNGAELIFFDWLGRGKSDDAENVNEYSIAHDVYIIESLRKHFGYDKISLVGHSYGTVPAQAYAIKYPDNVEKMVLINGFHSGAMWQANCDSYNHYSKTHFPEIWERVDSIRSLGYITSDPEHKEIYGSLPTKYIYYHNTSLRQNVPQEKYRGWSNQVYLEIIGPDADFDVSGDMIFTDFRRKLKDVKAQTLIIAGRYDGVSTPEYAVQYKKFMPQARFVMFENSGHNPYLEEAEKFYALFEEFMEL